MKKAYLPILLSVFCACSGGSAWAEKADKLKPMNVESDAMRYDDLKQTNVFTGRVLMTKGTIIIRGARVDVRQDAEGNQFGVVTAEPGKLAYFKQKRDGVDEYIEGEGETIEYSSKLDNVRFIKRAVMRRLVGSKVNDEITGALIVYDNVTDVFTVDSGNVGNNLGGQNTPNGRVRAMLTPKAAASAPAGTATPASPAPVLRPSTTLEGAPK
ncbi:lipopolysaccharide transport periplasmic protein LptA [Rhodoferax sp.]|uniref:lipopolysaccharide transport periplasmic protein LptA n=1 Tax=Rhodoferax sp. TaxID=50421 RepID=UPI00374C9165